MMNRIGWQAFLLSALAFCWSAAAGRTRGLTPIF